MKKAMNRLKAAHIIRIFARLFGLAALACALGAQAQGAGYQLQLTIDHQGRSYSVPMTAVPAGERVELPVMPAGLKVYSRTIGLGNPDQALVDLQVYETRGSSLSQLASLTMPAYLGTENSTEFKTVYGVISIRAYVDRAGGVQPGRAPAGEATPTPQLRGPENNRALPLEPEYRAPTPISGAPSPVPRVAGGAGGGQCVDPRYTES